MGCTAENLVDQHGISREDQDAFALESHARALHAQAEGYFDAEIVPLTVPQRKGTIVVERDEGPRAGSNLDKLARLRPIFRDDGSVTAGNSSSLNDGASTLLLASAAAVAELNLTAMARICGVAQAGVDPTIMGIGPVPATAKLLERVGWNWGDVDRVELNEAFAAQSLAVLKHWPIDRDRVNPNGGAIALGHPLGCSGARISATLVHELIRSDTRRGIATLCVGVGQGVATAFERV